MCQVSMDLSDFPTKSDLTCSHFIARRHAQEETHEQLSAKKTWSPLDFPVEPPQVPNNKLSSAKQVLPREKAFGDTGNQLNITHLAQTSSEPLNK